MIKLQNSLHLNKIFLHLIMGFIPLLVLFYIGLRRNNIITSSFEFSYPIIALFVLAAFVYFLVLSVSLLKIKLRTELYALILLLLLCLPLIMQGPFFQPPADTIFHSNILWDSLDKNIYDTKNRDFLNKVFFSFFINFINESNFISRINLIFIMHIFSTLTLIISAYFSSRLWGINQKWSVVSVILMVLFFGTNRFSYFTYYSLAPSSINFSFLWIMVALIANLSFKITKIKIKNILTFIYVNICILMIIPILYYSHHQEIGFLLFLSIPFQIMFLYNLLKTYLLKKYSIYLVYLFLIIFFYPYSRVPFLNRDSIFIHPYYLTEAPIYLTKVLYFWEMTNIRAPRILDSLGLFGLFPIALFLFFIILKNEINVRYWKGIVPTLFPFLIFYVPLNLAIWTALIPSPEVFWRITYMTQFWISMAFFLSEMESSLKSRLKRFIRI